MNLIAIPDAGFTKAIVEEPDDWTLRLIYADWLEEHGFGILAKGQRWQAENKKYSYGFNGIQDKKHYNVWGHNEKLQDDATDSWVYTHPWAMLPNSIYKNLAGSLISSPYWCFYSSVENAEEALAVALNLQ